ncbi:MAG: amino acid adenylation domain-containing protein, partial [Acidobacteriota bacterium]
CYERFHLKLVCLQGQEGLSFELHYDASRFQRDDLHRLSGQFLTLLQSALSDPQAPLGELQTLSPAERRQLVEGFNAAGVEFAQAGCLHRLFEIQAAQSPHRAAVAYEGQILSYGHLNRQADRLAGRLQKMGLGPGSLAAVFMERSLEMVVALWGALKAGGAYLPLNTMQPKERLRFVLEDARPAAVLIQAGLRGRLPESRIPALCLDGQWEGPAGEGADGPPIAAAPEEAAYVIFTSGSTGRPKGVVVEHRQIVNYTLGVLERLGLAQGSSFALVSTLAADLGNTSVYGALCSGGRLHVISEDRASDPSGLAQYFAEQRVDCLKIVPSHLASLQAGGHPEAVLPERCLVLGGEASRWEWVEELLGQAPQCRVLNHYGPTEAAVGVLTYPVKRPARGRRGALPLGWPLPNSRIYVLDEGLRPLPAWAAGELCIAGAGVSRGYLNRPGLTAEKFIPDPFASEPGGRLYRTGDLARPVPEGGVEFLGRIDRQVKLRGFRIELGEVEAVLSEHPGVREAVALVREDQPGDQRLTAYAVARPGKKEEEENRYHTLPNGMAVAQQDELSGNGRHHLNAARQDRRLGVPTEMQQAPPLVPAQVELSSLELREYLSGRLPEYMVPSAIVLLKSLPLTPNGKVDRQALPQPEMQESLREYRAPESPSQELLAGIWADVLSVERVGLDDNFFDLGGHSLLATQVIFRIRQAFAVEVALRTLFDAPLLSEMAQQVDGARLLQGQGAAPPLLPVPRYDDLPLSFAQQRLWFLDQLEPGTSSYNVPSALRLKGRLNIAALMGSLNEIRRRHEALRTCFPAQDGKPVQSIQPEYRLPLPIVDLCACPQDQRERELKRLVGQEADRPFDLAAGPLVRAQLLRLGEEDFALLATMHHIVSDGWSKPILVNELAAHYEAFSSGRPSPLQELPIQYADYAHWQRNWLSGEVLEGQLGYWKEKLGGSPAQLELPADRPRSMQSGSRGGVHSFFLPQDVSQGIQDLSRSESTTLFMTLLAVFQILLCRYSGREDVSVGSPIANRTRAETAGLIGFFVNTLVLRTDLSGQAGFREVLGRVRETALGAYEHQDIPFEQVVDALQPERSLHLTPLFQVMFMVQNAPAGSLKLSDSQVSAIEPEGATAAFDLTLAVTQARNGLLGSVEYSADLFDATTIRRMIGHFRNLLQGILADPDQKTSELPLSSPSERWQLLAEWNDTETEGAQGCTVLHRLVEAQVERTPQSIAVTFEGRAVSYRELESLSNQLAHFLGASGVRAGAVVAVCLQPGAELAALLLGILKSGAAYLPLDPAYPPRRLEFMLGDSAAALLLDEGEADGLRLPQGTARIERDQLWEQAALYGKESGATEVLAEQLAYVIYTSGTMGRPKGVGVPHRAICNHMRWMSESFPLGAADRVLQKTPFSFDASVWEFYAPLMAGAELAVARPGGYREVDYLLQTIALRQITVLQAVPSLLQLLVREGLAQCASLRRVYSGGEALGPDLQRRFLGVHSPELINLYGPTEACIDSLFWRCRPGHPGRPVPIGRPVSNLKARLLDGWLQPVAIGVAGELYLSGKGLARGYLNRPAETAAGFLPDAMGSEAGGRLYRTGDRARQRSDGALEFLGRADFQVKVRGFRIEPGEIEALLGQHPEVRQAVVSGQGDRPERMQLVAYLVAQNDALSRADLSNFLRERLPEYMLPSAFVMLDTLPLTPSGKVDRKALLQESLLEAGGEWAPPSTPTQELLAVIWSGLLSIEKVGALDNFFELGGHSLLATQVISRIRQVFEVELALRELFEAPTLAGLALRIEDARLSEQRSLAPPLVPVPRDRSLPLSFAQQRLWFLDQLEPGSSIYNMPTALRLSGRLNLAALQAAI